MAHDHFYGICENKCLVEIKQDNIPGRVGKDLTGQTVSIAYDGTTETTVTAAENAEIFNDYRERTYEFDEINQAYREVTGNVASGNNSHAEGCGTTASGKSSHAEGHRTIASYDESHAEGHYTTASGGHSHAEGDRTTASGDNSHAEGSSTTAEGTCSHAEGQSTTASGVNSHAEGCETTAEGTCSHAEGQSTTASGVNSHAEGCETTAGSNQAHAEGYLTMAIGLRAHAEGQSTTASGECSHAEGYKTTASGEAAHAEGRDTKAAGIRSHAGGYGTIANNYQFVRGKYNISSNGPASPGDNSGNIFIIGNGGSNDTRSNAFRLTETGAVYGRAAYNSSGADYAEMWEIEGGNPDGEDWRGLFVTVNENNKISKANPNDYILGVISATPCVVGDVQSEVWHNMYLKDVFGEHLTETVEVEETTDEHGYVTPAHTETRWILNPDYDSSKEYISRDERQEWAAVGLMGKLIVIDDGTCKPGQFCKVADGGIATASGNNEGYRVLERKDENHIQILFR